VLLQVDDGTGAELLRDHPLLAEAQQAQPHLAGAAAAPGLVDLHRAAERHPGGGQPPGDPGDQPVDGIAVARGLARQADIADHPCIPPCGAPPA